MYVPTYIYKEGFLNKNGQCQLVVFQRCVRLQASKKARQDKQRQQQPRKKKQKQPIKETSFFFVRFNSLLFALQLPTTTYLLNTRFIINFFRGHHRTIV